MNLVSTLSLSSNSMLPTYTVTFFVTLYSSFLKDPEKALKKNYSSEFSIKFGYWISSSSSSSNKTGFLFIMKLFLLDRESFSASLK